MQSFVLHQIIEIIKIIDFHRCPFGIVLYERIQNVFGFFDSEKICDSILQPREILLKEDPEFSLEIRDPESGFWRKFFDWKSKNFVFVILLLLLLLCLRARLRLWLVILMFGLTLQMIAIASAIAIVIASAIALVIADCYCDWRDCDCEPMHDCELLRINPSQKKQHNCYEFESPLISVRTRGREEDTFLLLFFCARGSPDTDPRGFTLNIRIEDSALISDSRAYVIRRRRQNA